MISTYHTIFLVTFVVSIVLLLFLVLYIPVFHVFHTIGWLTGISKRKEMQSYDENGMAVTTKAVNKKAKSSKDKPGALFEASAPAASSDVFEESSGKASKSEKSSKKNIKKSSRKKKSATEQFAEPATETFEESSDTNLFVEDSAEDIASRQRGTDIFSEESASADEVVEEASRGTDIFTEDTHETDIFTEAAGDAPVYRGTDILSDEDDEPAYRGTDILSDDEEDSDEIFISVGSEIPGNNDSSHDTELFDDSEV